MDKPLQVCKSGKIFFALSRLESGMKKPQKNRKKTRNTANMTFDLKNNNKTKNN